MSKIEWTDKTWNPATGCTKISKGCDHCYAHTFAERFRGLPGHHFEQGFDLKLHPERLTLPLAWKTPKRVFVCSMADLFLKDIPDDFRDRVFDSMEQTPQHQYQVLTKRSSLMRDYVRQRYAGGQPPAHIWLGVTVEDASCVSRIRHLQDTPAAIRFLSLEPLLGPLAALDLTGISWVIVGGESDAQAREMHPDWVDEILDQCILADVKFFFKQWGGKNKKKSGRLLHGCTWDEQPA